MFKRILTFVLLWTGCIFAQSDIRINPARNAFIKIATNVQFGVSGAGGMNNNYILAPISDGNQNLCLYVQNLGGTGEILTVNAYQTSDPSVVTYNGNTNAWNQILTSPVFNFGPNANSTQAMFIRAKASSAIALIFSGGTAGINGNVFAVQTNNDYCPLAQYASLSFTAGSKTTISAGAGIYPLIQCDVPISGTIAAGVTNFIAHLPSPFAPGTALAICWLQITNTVAVTQGTQVLSTSNTFTGCGGLSAFFTLYTNGTGVGSFVQIGGQGSSAAYVNNDTLTRAICLTNNNAVGTIQYNGMAAYPMTW